MSKRERRLVNLADFKKAKRDEGSIEIEGEDGQIYQIDPPELWPDEIQALAKDGDSVGMARALLGDSYDAFVAAGGSANLIGAIIADQHGVSAGE